MIPSLNTERGVVTPMPSNCDDVLLSCGTTHLSLHTKSARWCLSLQLEAAAAVAREEKRKGEAALEAAEARFAAREALLKEEWDRWAETAPSLLRGFGSIDTSYRPLYRGPCCMLQSFSAGLHCSQPVIVQRECPH